MTVLENSPCPVCGYGMPHRPDNFNICACCGTEFGYDDAGRSHEELTAIWVSGGAKWWSPIERPPDGWDPIEQLSDAGIYVRDALQTSTSRSTID